MIRAKAGAGLEPCNPGGAIWRRTPRLRLTPIDRSEPTPSGSYSLAFLTDEWEWEADLAAETFSDAKAAARQALADLVRDEAPALACVTLLDAGAKLGVWDWVDRQPYWTPL
jgi:hypothetical protein